MMSQRCMIVYLCRMLKTLFFSSIISKEASSIQTYAKNVAPMETTVWRSLYRVDIVTTKRRRRGIRKNARNCFNSKEKSAPKVHEHKVRFA